MAGSVYQVLITSTAEKEMGRLPVFIHRRVTTRILALAANPRPPGCKKLQGLGGFRLRVGDYRILYAVEDQSATVTVVSVAHRREAYRQ